MGRRIAIFGLTVSSSWGNGHATLWRGLLRALVERGHRVTFYERDVPYYANARDLAKGEGWRLVLYPSWESVRDDAMLEVARADVAMVTSYCPDAIVACELLFTRARGLKVFYDLDTPVTLSRLDRGESVEYVPRDGLGEFDLVLSFTGGRALEALERRLGARRARPLYGSADPATHRPCAPDPRYAADLSYLGTWAADRQKSVERLLVEPARRAPTRRFVIGGSKYPREFPWTDNIWFFDHVPPPEHPAFYCSSRMTLNVTRGAMASMGFCPSGRLFEAASCGVPIVTDSWEGLETFFRPGEEIVVASDPEAAVAAMELSDRDLASMAAAARERVLGEHTADRRASEMLEHFDSSR